MTKPVEGWKLVPVAITAEIACALEGAAPPDQWPDGDPHGAIPELMRGYADTWARVLAAAPSPPDGGST